MKIRKLLTIPGLVACAAVPAITIASCGNIPQNVLITSLTLSKKITELETDTATQIAANITPANATNKKLSWSVNKPNIATINEKGVLTAKTTGQVEITATTTDGSEISAKTTINIVAPTTSSETYNDYIFNRSFSLITIFQTSATKAGAVFGTGWILSDATPNDPTDYVYYIATNWHVIKGEEDAIASAYQGNYLLRFGCDSASSGVDISGSVKFLSFEKISDSEFTYDNKTTITTTQSGETKTGLQGVDAFIAKADFGGCATETTRASAPIAKAKLDYLNSNFTAKGKKITQLAPTTTDDQHFESKKLYTGGFPFSSSLSRSKWEYHDLSEAQTSYYGTTTVPLTYTKQGQKTHWSDNHDSPQIDCSPQYAYTGNDYLKNWMCGGASGSMLIANFGTDSASIWRVVGIYWGGLGWEDKTTGDEYIQPYYSIFNSDWKNYFEQWQ